MIPLWYTISAETNECVICAHIKCHAPCILNLSTGEIGELELYQPHATKVGEIANGQNGGTFSFIRPAGLRGIRVTDPWYIEVNIPILGEKKEVSLFCMKCRPLLTEYKVGYVLLDLYSEDVPKVYGLDNKLDYRIRCYEIRLTRDLDSEEFILRVDGVWNDE